MVDEKLPAFMIAENPVSEQSRGKEFILHTRNPRLLIRVLEITDMDEKEKEKLLAKMVENASLTFVNGEEFLLYPVQVYDQTPMPVKDIASFMRRAADWWHAYIKWEADNAPEEF